MLPFVNTSTRLAAAGCCCPLSIRHDGLHAGAVYGRPGWPSPSSLVNRAARLARLVTAEQIFGETWLEECEFQ